MSAKKTIDWSCKHEILILNRDGSYSRMDEPYFESKEIVPGVWQVLSSGDYSYCVAGKTKAVAIDTGYGAGNIREYLEELTGLPVPDVINTHSHFDHTANNGYFDRAYMAKKAIPHATIPFASFAGIEFPQDYERVGIAEGFVYELDDKRLEIFDIPDHTADGIAILDRSDRMLFTGDEFMIFGKILERVSLTGFYHYVRKLEAYRSEFDYVCAGFGYRDAALLDAFEACAGRILDGERGTPFVEIGGRPEKMPPGPCGELVYDRCMPHFGDGGAGKLGETDREMYQLAHDGIAIIYDSNNI